jgi:radical SAM-linked protein
MDFQRQLQLALRRSGLPIAYSKGYHPHPLLKFGPPLSVGVGGERENLDLALVHSVTDCVERLKAALPPGIAIRRAAVVGATTPRSIDHSVERFEYRITLPSIDEGGMSEDLVAAAVETFLARASWPFLRQRPGKDDIEIEVRTLVPDGGLTMETRHTNMTNGANGSRLHLKLLRGEGGAGLPVHDFLTCLFGEALAEPRHCHITRTGYSGRDRSGRWQTPLEEVGESSRRFWLMRELNC